jgi:hypothetical protein
MPADLTKIAPVFKCNQSVSLLIHAKSLLIHAKDASTGRCVVGWSIIPRSA